MICAKAIRKSGYEPHIFELGKVFRRGEVSSRHAPEFTMLEYYRLGFSEFDLMADITRWIGKAYEAFGKPVPAVRYQSYRAWFQDALGIEPLTEPLNTLQRRVQALGVIGEFDRDTCLDLLRTHQLEATLPAQELCFIYDFPATQAALAQLNTDGDTARRFELFHGGFELANGYFELTDANEQRRRFDRDVALRRARGMPAVALDQHFLAALEAGMPSCAGVAVGLDRLLMVLTGQAAIEGVIWPVP
jgi:elongation factor P--(R)-beta-lysine ligase